MAEGMLSLSWNNHSSTFCHMLSALREVERYTDVTVACEGKFYPVHKLVLSTCSDYFSKMFEITPCKHPIIVLKDIQCKDLEALLSYMYAGLVSVAQSDLSQLIKAAELLQIKGLAVPDEPPTSSRKVRNLTDSCNSPHPKRHKRQEPNHGELYSDVLSSPSTPLYIDDEQQEHQADTPKEPQIASDKLNQAEADNADDKESGQVDQKQSNRIANQTDNNVENDAAAQDCPSSQDEAMIEETLIKEELVDEESNSEVPSTVFNYGNLIAEVGGDSNEADDKSNIILSARYNEQCREQSFLHHQYQHSENSSEAPPGPALLQAWHCLSEVGECSSGGQGFSRDMNQDTSLPGHLESQALYPMVSPTTDGQITSGGGTQGTMKNRSAIHKLHQSPYIYYSNSETEIFQTSFFPLRKKNKKPFSCAQCPYATSSRSNLIIHLRTHTGERPYSCPECTFTASFEYNLKVHMRTHTGEKPYKCPNCPLKFAQKAHLKNHTYTHTGERPFSCQFCSARFSRRSNLSRHIRTHQ